MKRHYYLKEVFLVLITTLILSTACVYGAEESITVTTYYPSPYGVYSEMRLYPKDNPTACDANQRGLMYYDNTANQLRICTGTPPYLSLSGYWAASPLNPDNIYNTNTGNVGIGTTDPLQFRLYLNANVPTPAGRNGMQIATPLGHYVSLGGGIGTDGSNTAGLHIGNQAGNNIGGEGGTLYYDYDAPDHSLIAASTGGIRIAALGQYPPAGRDIIFGTNPSNIERMRITDGGNVGIGTSDPKARLHIVGDIVPGQMGEVHINNPVANRGAGISFALGGFGRGGVGVDVDGSFKAGGHNTKVGLYTEVLTPRSFSAAFHRH